MSDIDALVETVREGAAFYMNHRMREYPHPNAPEITMGEHTPNDPDCKGCHAQAALDDLASLARQQSAADAMWRAENDRAKGAEGERDRLQQRLRNNHDDVRKASERAETAYQERDRLKAALREIAHVHDDGPLGTHEGDIARAALADVGGTEETSA